MLKKKEKLKEKFADSKKMKENGESRRFKEQKKNDRDSRKCGNPAVSIYDYNSLNFLIRPDLSIRNNDNESLSADIASDKIRNTIVNVLYRPTNGQIELKLYFFPNFSHC